MYPFQSLQHRPEFLSSLAFQLLITGPVYQPPFRPQVWVQLLRCSKCSLGVYHSEWNQSVTVWQYRVHRTAERGVAQLLGRPQKKSQDARQHVEILRENDQEKRIRWSPAGKVLLAERASGEGRVETLGIVPPRWPEGGLGELGGREM